MLESSLTLRGLQERFTAIQGNVIEALEAMDKATLAIGDPQPIREQIENLRELFTALWLLHDSGLTFAGQKQRRSH